MISKSETANINYLASVQSVEIIRKHSNADRLQCVNIAGNNLITGLNTKEGDLVVYFPLGCAISREFLSFFNSFSDGLLNRDILTKGFFGKNGLVKAVRLRDEKSEGYIVPVEDLQKFCREVLKKELVINNKCVGEEFDTIFDYQICRKYINPAIAAQQPRTKTKGRIKENSILVDRQFNFHPDTPQLKREMERINPDDYIAIVNKMHGCNFVVSNILTRRKLSWIERLAQKLGIKVKESEYGKIYSSRAVIKNACAAKDNNHFYDCDIWGIVANKIYPLLDKGISVYGEIVGYTPTGSMIQNGYDYGCDYGQTDFYIFRVTYTNQDGKVFEFSHRQVIDFCQKLGFKTPKTYYYGKAVDLFLLPQEHWHANFLEKMMETFLEKTCDMCKNNMPAEGVVLRNDSHQDWEAYKLKSFRFLQREIEEIDAGVADLETQESININAR